MLTRTALLLCLLLGLGWIASAEDGGSRQAPPPGRALPPAPELEQEGTVKAAIPVRHGSLREELEAHAAPSADEGGDERQAQPIRLDNAERPSFRLKPKDDEGTPRQFGRRVITPGPPLDPVAAPAPEPPAMPEPLQPEPETSAGKAPLRGKHATDPAQWGRFEPSAPPVAPVPEPLAKPQPNAQPVPPPDYQSAQRQRQPAKREFGSARPAAQLQFELPGLSLLELSGSFMLDSGTLVASTQGAAFSSGSSRLRSAPVELVLPQPPPRLPEPSVRAGMTEISRGNSKVKRVALTFDDGPHPEYTSQLLAILSHYDAKATFFVVGIQCQKYPHWVKMISQAGHELANHTFDHFRLPQLPQEEQSYQIDECTRLIEQLTGTTPRFFRPPGGRYDADIERLLRQRGMVLALWDAALNDTAEDREAADLLKSANTQIRPGSIVLVHDGVQATVDMLPQLIEALRKDGYEFVTLSELAAGL